MSADYLMLSVIATVIFGGGMFLFARARRYRAGRDGKSELGQTDAAARWHLSFGMQASAGTRDVYAAHEILDRTYCVATMLESLLLERRDLPQAVREQLDNASVALWAAYQNMGSMDLEVNPNPEESR